jgi:hypothetical protein
MPSETTSPTGTLSPEGEEEHVANKKRRKITNKNEFIKLLFVFLYILRSIIKILTPEGEEYPRIYK